MAWQADDGWVRHFVGAYEGSSLIGFATSSTALDTPDTTWVEVSVLPRHQHRGVGTRLVLAAEGASTGSVSRFVASAFRTSAAEIAVLVREFAEPLGYHPATTETVVELELVGADLPALRPPGGYSVSTYVDGVPAHLRAQVGVLKGLVDAQAPHGELGWQPAPVSVQEYQDEIALWQRQGRTAVESIALTAQGHVAAWTCLVVAADSRRPAQIEGTLVLEQHRGVGLGKAVKTASLLAARDLGSVTRVRTSSDDQNVWMRAVNHELGFVPVESEILLQKRVAPAS
ncbi:GNAT family N-acetyltransferase [Nocardioides mesophilus]|uniref:GNAT family N-acetyltransferase n=1 Tax=Nocardioides mesophilus TaxID=433659 RepID=A0A7G9RFX6_9ACTN|nr:GNAT family N-acetyltransferase [Nocardioides mesophilus]QNN54501.1 GNAT family N-acetyltransferase [Nocardioides mesophilus]